MANQEPSPQFDKEAFEEIAAAEVLIEMGMERCIGCPLLGVSAQSLVSLRGTEYRLDGLEEHITRSIEGRLEPAPDTSESRLLQDIDRLRSENSTEDLLSKIEQYHEKCRSGWQAGRKLPSRPNHEINCGMFDNESIVDKAITRLLSRLSGHLFE